MLEERNVQIVEVQNIQLPNPIVIDKIKLTRVKKDDLVSVANRKGKRQITGYKSRPSHRIISICAQVVNERIFKNSASFIILQRLNDNELEIIRIFHY